VLNHSFTSWWRIAWSWKLPNRVNVAQTWPKFSAVSRRHLTYLGTDAGDSATLCRSAITNTRIVYPVSHLERMEDWGCELRHCYFAASVPRLPVSAATVTFSDRAWELLRDSQIPYADRRKNFGDQLTNAESCFMKVVHLKRGRLLHPIAAFKPPTYAPAVRDAQMLCCCSQSVSLILRERPRLHDPQKTHGKSLRVVFGIQPSLNLAHPVKWVEAPVLFFLTMGDAYRRKFDEYATRFQDEATLSLT